jgi:UDP-N-acetylmuramoyl-L-alanyl-D-glutamate--2,6-diaminopimelate ligase
MINIKSDSRKVKPGDTFIALPGIEGDGHDYIESAIKNGATKIIAEHGNYSVETVIVPSTREYLYNYLETNYNKYLDEMTIIGITGTNGKTTSCYLIYQMLNLLGKKCAYIGTIGYYLDKKICSLANTCPDTCDLYDYIINAYDLGYRYVALEASSVGLLYKRINNMPFDYAIFTNLTHSHGESHPTMEDYALAKQLLFKKLKPTGKAIVNIDDKYAPYYLLEGNHNITYGFNKSDYQMSDYQVNDFNTYFNYIHNDQTYNIHSKLIGKYNVYN